MKLFTGGDRSVAGRLRGLLYAVQMERTLGRRAIMALHLNTANRGPDVCGADAAARACFGERPQPLTPLGAAWLASILPARIAAGP
jgi:membrane carboxypeptidase/penicillin-binding protein PbpC